MRLHAFGPMIVIALVGCGDKAGSAPDLSAADASVDCVAHPELCGGCVVDPDCKTPDLPRCYLNTCVACLPSDDNCPQGQVCHQTFSVWTCGTTCVGNGDCERLGGGSLCCNGFCVNPATDVAHCGACGHACGQVPNGAPGCVGGNCVIGQCNPGYEDCDQQPINGCETGITSDALNCGACRSICKPFTNGLPTCSAGKCAAICAPNYADCDNNIANGCEIDSTYDIANCGGCGRACGSPANGNAACDQGKCSFTCKLNFGNCDGNPINGCEVNTATDAVHCGHCGNNCPLRPNSMASSCANGQCTNACQMGFGDCDNKAFNGCEADLSTNLVACGACGKACKNNNAMATCSMGVCTLQCNAGYVDCNMDPADGCEASLLIDAMNCGQCGNVCPANTPHCDKGNCTNKPCPGEAAFAQNLCWVKPLAHMTTQQQACASINRQPTAYSLNIVWDDSVLTDVAKQWGFTSAGVINCCAHAMWCNVQTKQCGTHSFGPPFDNYGPYGDALWWPVYTCTP